jgi:hypothetical protein
MTTHSSQLPDPHDGSEDTAHGAAPSHVLQAPRLTCRASSCLHIGSTSSRLWCSLRVSRRLAAATPSGVWRDASLVPWMMHGSYSCTRQCACVKLSGHILTYRSSAKITTRQ